MYVITFYSFKGGVGRTLALVNVAAELVRMGRRVLVVDFDLEAPGLETFERLRPAQPRSGVVEYVKEYLHTQQSPDVREYVYAVGAVGRRNGQWWVMPAGRRDANYQADLANLDWKHLYRQCQGYWFFEDTKKQWEEAFQPDYVLIDSRTGHTDLEGICTRQLPDSVVLMFTPNEQNLVGLENVCRDIRREEMEGLKKTIRMHFVAANVPDLDDEHRIVRRQLAAFCERLRIPDSPSEICKIRRYESFRLLDQSIFTLDRPRTKLARSYRRLVRTLLKDNLADRDGALAFLQDYPKRHETRSPGEEGVFSAEWPLPPLTSAPQRSAPPAPLRATLTSRSLPADAPDNKTRGHLIVFVSDGRGACCIAFWRDMYSLHQIGNTFNDDAEILIKVAKCFILEEDFRGAIQMLDRVLQLQPDFVDALLCRASCHTNLGEIDDAADDLLACLRALRPGRRKPKDGVRADKAWLSREKLADAIRQSAGEVPSATGDSLSPFGEYIQDLGLRQNCLRRFCVLASARKLEKIAEIVERQEIEGIDLPIVIDYLSRREEGVPIAARLLRNHIARLPESEKMSFGMPLLQARCWRDVIQLHEGGRLENGEAGSILQLGIAHWGEHGELPESLCRRALKALEGLESDRQHVFFHNWGWEAGALLLWRVGEKAEAIECLEKGEQRAHTESAEEIFSLWRLHEVSVGHYLDDIKLWRRMFQGEPLRPAFLGPSSG
jgi:MinD-like ATPase involved in chromosome partitioning or flagellar assembly